MTLEDLLDLASIASSSFGSSALGVSKSGFYVWKDRPDPPPPLRRIWLAGEIANVHKASAGIYGAHRVTA